LQNKKVTRTKLKCLGRQNNSLFEKMKNVVFLFIAVCELDLLITNGDGFLLLESWYMFTKF